MSVIKSFKYSLSIILLITFLLMLILLPGIFYNLQVRHIKNNKIFLSFPFILNNSFSISYINSIYLVPVIEKYKVKYGRIYLEEIITSSWGVVEYYNINDAETVNKDNKEIHIGKINYYQPYISLITGYTGKQQLIIKEKIYSLYDYVGAGEKVKIEPVPISVLKYIQDKIMVTSKN